VVDQSVFVVTLAHVATIAAMLGGAYHCSQAFVDHMWGPDDSKVAITITNHAMLDSSKTGERYFHLVLVKPWRC
jgi:hypothetical protein